MQRVSLRQTFTRPRANRGLLGTVNGTLLGNQNRPVPNSRPFTVARDSVSIQCSRIIQRHVQRITSSANLSRGPEPTEDCWATVNGTLQGNQNRQYRTVVHSRWLETPVSIQCSQIVQRHVHRITSSAKLSRGPEPTEDCWATVNGTLSVTKNRPVPNSRPFTVARDSCLDSVQPNRSASRAAW